MKKSNRVFIALIATLYIVPALTFGAAQFTSEKCLTGFTQKFQIIQIDNPELKAENIKVDTRTASEFPRGQILEAKDRSLLYYEGMKRYLPEVSRHDSLLLVSGARGAMRGEIDFCESFRQRCALLKGLDVSVMQEIAENLPITEGVDRLMRILKKVGFKIAILSGGFTYFGNFLKQKYNIDYVYANELEIENGKLTGNHVGDIVDGKRKAELLRLIAQVENVDIRQTVAVGDGANDLPMISIAGLGIAFHAKPKVKATAKQSISTIGLDGILYFLGYKDSYLDEQM